jgi:hypothetical protein
MKIRKLTKYILLLSITWVFSACSLFEGDKTTYTLSGELVESCENPTGVAGVELWLQKEKDAGKIEWLDNVTTAANGSFELKYEAGSGAAFGNVYIKKRGTYSNAMIMMGIPTKQNLDLGLVYNGWQEVKVSVLINTSIATSEGDSLSLGHNAGYLDNGNYKRLVLSGPFIEGQEILNYTHEGSVQWYKSSIDYYKYVDTDYSVGPTISYFINGKSVNTKMAGWPFAVPCEQNIVTLVLDSTLFE